MMEGPTLTPASVGSIDPELNSAPETDLKMEVKKQEEEEEETQEEEAKREMEAVHEEVKSEEKPEVRGTLEILEVKMTWHKFLESNL